MANKFIKIALLAIFVFPLSCLANGSSPLPFQDNQTVNVKLSDTNINRIVVQGDQITHVDCPNGFCTSKHNDNDQSGSAIIKLNTPIPFTLFLQTRLGHFVSLQVTPEQESGKTVVLNPLSATTTAEKWEKDSSYRKTLVQLIKAMMNGQVPDGYGYQPIKNADWRRVFNDLGKIQVKAIWTGAHVLGIQYLFYNDSNRTLVLPESAFYHQGVLLVATAEQSLPKHSYEYVYEIVDRGADHG